MKIISISVQTLLILGAILSPSLVHAANVHVYKAIIPGDRMLCSSLFSLAYIESYNQDRVFLGPRTGGPGTKPMAEVAESRDFIYNVYSRVISEGKRDNVFTENFIADIKRQDDSLPADHVAYFVAWDPSGTKPLGAMRVVYGGDRIWWEDLTTSLLCCAFMR